MLEHKQFCLEGIKRGAKCGGCPNKKITSRPGSWAGFLGGGESGEHNPHLKGRVVGNQLERQLHGAEWEGMRLAVLGED